MNDVNEKLSGVITALVTPFKHGELDVKSFIRLIRHQLEQGVHGFVVNGTTGESPSLSREEVKTLFEIAKTETGGQASLIVGTGSNSTAATVEFTKEVSRWGADAVLVVVPYYNKPPQRGLEQHFNQVARHAHVPVLLYNVPSRTVANMEPATVGRLSFVPGIAGIKDATGDMGVLQAIQAVSNKGFVWLSGDDASCVEFCARGGHGVISVSSHIIGKEMAEFLRQARAGDRAVAEAYRARYADLMKHLYIEANPIPVKMALHWMGLLESPELRLPLVSLDEKFHKEFKACLNHLGKL